MCFTPLKDVSEPRPEIVNQKSPDSYNEDLACQTKLHVSNLPQLIGGLPYFACWVILHVLFFASADFFQNLLLKIRVSNSLDPDQA